MDLALYLFLWSVCVLFQSLGTLRRRQLNENGLNTVCCRTHDILAEYRQHQCLSASSADDSEAVCCGNAQTHSCTATQSSTSTESQPEDAAPVSRHEVCSASAGMSPERLSLKWYCRRHAVDCIIAVHAYRPRNFLIDCGIPFVVVYGGTDISQDTLDESRVMEMTPLIHQARRLVCFTQAMLDRALEVWPFCSDKLRIQHHGIGNIESSVRYSQSLLNWLRELAGALHPVPDNANIFMLVAGIRPVKDPLYLVDSMDDWHREDSSVYMVVIGEELDKDCYHRLQQRLSRSPSVFYSDSVPQPFFHHLVRQCTAVVNSSLAEGMPQAVMEAVSLSVPVIVRSIPANLAVVTHMQTGLVFSSPEEFVALARMLLQDTAMRSQLTRNALTYAAQHHSWRQEAEFYCQAVAEMS